MSWLVTTGKLRPSTDSWAEEAGGCAPAPEGPEGVGKVWEAPPSEAAGECGEGGWKVAASTWDRAEHLFGQG